MEKISVLLLLVGVLEFLSKNPSFGIEINNECSTLFHKLKGKALSGHVISVHQASSEIACTHKCLSNLKCASFNFEIQQSRSLSTCELNAVSRTSPYNKLESRDGFAYYEPVTPRERPKQQVTAFSQTSNLITEAATTQGTQAVSPTQDEATTPASRVPSTQSAITPGPAFSPTTSNLIMEASTTEGTQKISPTLDQATTPASRVPSTQPATTAAPVSNCGQHWHAYKFGCLRLFPDRKDWVAAQDHCANFTTPGKGNGRLISIFSQDDNDQIVKLRLSLNLPQAEYYIGLNDLEGTGTYKWADGTNASFTNWKNGRPNGREGGVVIKMYGNLDYGKWQTKDSNSSRRFICECPAGPCA